MFFGGVVWKVGYRHRGVVSNWQRTPVINCLFFVLFFSSPGVVSCGGMVSQRRVASQAKYKVSNAIPNVHTGLRQAEHGLFYSSTLCFLFLTWTKHIACTLPAGISHWRIDERRRELKDATTAQKTETSQPQAAAAAAAVRCCCLCGTLPRRIVLHCVTSINACCVDVIPCIEKWRLTYTRYQVSV